jgi:pimeloyl-ACP methyl ester carboxylesterase
VINAAVRQLGLTRPVIVGHSLGGAVALAYGALFPEEVSGVVAVAPMAYANWGVGHLGFGLRAIPVLGPVLSNTLLALTDPLKTRAAARLIFSPQKPTASFKERVPVSLSSRPSALAADGADFIGASWDLRRLGRVFDAYPAPVHIVVGSKDRVLKPSRQAERMARALKGAGLTTVEGAGHMVHHVAPEAVLAAIEDVRTRAPSLLRDPLAA